MFWTTRRILFQKFVTQKKISPNSNNASKNFPEFICVNGQKRPNTITKGYKPYSNMIHLCNRFLLYLMRVLHSLHKSCMIFTKICHVQTFSFCVCQKHLILKCEHFLTRVPLHIHFFVPQQKKIPKNTQLKQWLIIAIIYTQKLVEIKTYIKIFHKKSFIQKTDTFTSSMISN